MKSVLKLLFLALLAPLVTHVNTVFASSQRAGFTFEYALQDKQLQTEFPLHNDNIGNGVTLADILATYTYNDGSNGTAAGGYTRSEFVFAQKDGNYRINLILSKDFARYNSSEKFTNGSFVNVQVLDGAIVSTQIEDLTSSQKSRIQDQIDQIFLPLRDTVTRIDAYLNQWSTQVNQRLLALETWKNGLLASINGLINTAKGEAIQAAANDATTKADSAKTAAVADSKTYTDAEILKIKGVSDLNLKEVYFYDIPVGPVNGDPANISGVLVIDPRSFDFSVFGNYFLETTLKNADQSVNLTNEGKVWVYASEGASTYTEVLVTTNDKILIESYKNTVTGVSEIRFVRIHQDFVKEAFVSTNEKVDANYTALTEEIDEAKAEIYTALTEAIDEAKAELIAMINA